MRKVELSEDYGNSVLNITKLKTERKNSFRYI